jgi:signal transduction histidine kinase
MHSDNYPRNRGTAILLSRLKDIASSILDASQAGSLEQVLERIAVVSSELVHARYAALGVPDEDGELRYFKVAGMTAEEVSHLAHLPRGRGLLGAIMKERKPIRVTRMQEDPRSGGFCSGHPTMTSLLGVPIQVGDRLLGIFYLCDRVDGQPFSEEDEWLVETMAGYAALAIAGSELREQQNRLTLLEERERIGMELHDGVIQSLYAIGLHLDLMRTSPEQDSTELDGIVENLNEVISDIRRYILNLKASSFRQQSVYDSLINIVARLHVPENVHVEIEAPHAQPPFTPGVFEAICQMANEAISNALRHANASFVKITAGPKDDSFQITIADDGQGFNLGKTQEDSGLGLHNLQQRAHLHGGHVHIDTSPGRGTRVSITIPL